MSTKISLKSLVEKHSGCCYYCKVHLTVRTPGEQRDTDATVEHLIDKWSSRKHIKNNDKSNIVAACFKCNNTRGNARNRIARDYYQLKINRTGIKQKAASISSATLYKMFGPIPQELFKV